MNQLLDIARVSADNAKGIAGGILCAGIGQTQVELLAQAVADLANAVEALAEHIQPRVPTPLQSGMQPNGGCLSNCCPGFALDGACDYDCPIHGKPASVPKVNESEWKKAANAVFLDNRHKPERLNND